MTKHEPPLTAEEEEALRLTLRTPRGRIRTDWIWRRRETHGHPRRRPR